MKWLCKKGLFFACLILLMEQCCLAQHRADDIGGAVVRIVRDMRARGVEVEPRLDDVAGHIDGAAAEQLAGAGSSRGRRSE